MGTLYILTISFIVLLQIKHTRGDNASNGTTKNNEADQQGSFDPSNNVTNQEQSKQLSTSSLPNTNDTISLSDNQASRNQTVINPITTYVPSIAPEKNNSKSEKASRGKDNFNDSEASGDNLKSSSNTTDNGPTTQSPSNQNTTATSGHINITHFDNVDVDTTKPTQDTPVFNQTTSSITTVAEDEIEILNITTERINSTCFNLMWQINLVGNFTFRIKPGKLEIDAENNTRFKATVCPEIKPGKITTFKIKPFIAGNTKKSTWGEKKVYFEPAPPINLTFNRNNNELAWKKGNGRIDYYELRYMKNNTEMVEETNNTQYVFQEMIPGEAVNIALRAVRNFTKDDITLKSEPVFKEITKVPLPPLVNIMQGINFLDVSLQSRIGYRDGYIITIESTDTQYNETRSYNDRLYSYTIPGLIPAHYYNITVVSFSNGVKSQPASTRASTCPQIHNVTVENVTSSSFTVTWNGDYNSDTVIEVQINDTKGPHYVKNYNQKHIDNLNSTTVYSVDVTFSLNGCKSTSDTVYKLTMDAYLEKVEGFNYKFKKRNNKLVLKWKQPNNAKNTTKYYEVSFEDLNNNSQNINKTTYTTEMDFNATYGECYDITITGVNKAGRGEDFQQYIYIPEDVPENVSDVRATNITSRSVTIQWKVPAVFKGTIVKYTVALYDSDNITFAPVKKKTLQCDESCYKSQCLTETRESFPMEKKTFEKVQNELEVKFKDLAPYHNYMVEVTAFTRNNESEPVEIQFMTHEDRPGRIDKNSIVTDVNSSDATIKWKPPSEPNGVILSYNIELLNNIETQHSINTTFTSVTFSNLQQNTQYTVRIKAQTSKGYGNFSEEHDFSTKSSDLSKIIDFEWKFENEKNQVKMTWKKPENGIESDLNYSIKIVDLNSNTTEIKDSDNTETRFDVIYGECYDITITGVNKAGRGEDFNQYIYIPEDVPENVSDVRTNDIQSRSVRIQWKAPAVFKGTIVKYTVALYDPDNIIFTPLSKKTLLCDESCYKSQCLNSNLRQQRSVMNRKPFKKDEKTFEVEFKDLTPYHSYSVEVTAYTRNNESEPVQIQFTTHEDKPGRIDKNSIKTDVNSSDATVKWKPPLEPNGVILSYNIELLNNNETQHSINTTVTSVTFSNLQQNTQYTVRIKAHTSRGYGNFSDDLNFSTKLKVPSKPGNVKIRDITSTSVTVTWTQPATDLNISHYVQVNDTVFKTENRKVHCGHNPGTASSCLVPGLRPFWKYSLQVNVANNEGASSSEIITVLTLGDKPGKVSRFEATPENDPYQPRTISLEWEPPNIKDSNGIIMNYVISYGPSYQDKKEIKIGFEMNNYVLRDIATDVEYEIKLAAVTQNGTGVDDTKTVIVPPGILPKPIEVVPLIQHLPNHLVQEKQHQIPLQLPLGFLCNVSYGEIVNRGILATRGTRFVTPERIYGLNYPSWDEAKDSKTLLTYQVSSLPSLRNCRYEEGSKVFIVGNDKECKNVQEKYCNGPLLPDTIYRFKVYMCTEAGCTYSNFSYPIKTDKVSNTMMIMICIIVVLIVCIIPAIITFVLYKKKKACFIMYDEDDEKNNLDLRVYKSNRNRPVKLSNFDAHVQALHLNTNVGFSEEYKVIKQLSPKYSTKAAERESCRIKNRYTNVLPFDYTRVKLLPVDDEEDSEYINANYLSGYNGKREYIAAQGPLPSTTDDFWRMLWENQVSVVVMLTQCMEKGRVKCEKYWPDSSDPVYYGDLVVELRSESNLPDYNIRVLDIKLGTKTRTIKQFHFLKWPDFGCPEKTWLLLNFVAAVRAHLSNSSTGPIVVHCSAGVGRTGTFIATDMLLQQIHDSEEIDIFGLVLDMRENRSLMVQTENQYIYIHDCIRDALIDDTDEEEIEENIYENDAIYENA